MVTCFYKFEVLVFSVGRKKVYSWKIVKTKIFSELTKKTAEGILGKKKQKKNVHVSVIALKLLDT